MATASLTSCARLSIRQHADAFAVDLVDGTWDARFYRAMNRKTCADASFADLLDCARAGDQTSLEELFRRYQPRIGEWAAQRLRKPLPGLSRPSDIAQETVLHAFRRFSTFSGETESE